MYLDYFGFTQAPFSITPDPGFLFLSHDHKEAFAHLLYGVGDTGGFVQLTGEVGTGKTTLCRYLLENTPDEVDVALILNPRQSALELVEAKPADKKGRSLWKTPVQPLLRAMAWAAVSWASPRAAGCQLHW